MELKSIFDLKKQHLCRRISQFTDKGGGGGKISHLAAGRICTRISHLFEREGGRISHLAVLIEGTIEWIKHQQDYDRDFCCFVMTCINFVLFLNSGTYVV